MHLAAQRAQLAPRHARDVGAVEPHAARRSARAAAGCSCRPSTCRCPTRRPGRPPRPRRSSGRSRRPPARRGRRRRRTPCAAPRPRAPGRSRRHRLALAAGMEARDRVLGPHRLQRRHHASGNRRPRAGSAARTRSSTPPRCATARSRGSPAGARPPATRGTAPSSPIVYGCCGAANSSSTGASSTLRPAYMTTTRSARSATTPRSWVISTIAVPSRSRSPRITSSTPAWIVTSSAVVGSSAISTSGSQAIAIAIITRWRMPPESWCGYSPTRCVGRRDAHQLEQLDACARGRRAWRGRGGGAAPRRSGARR